MADSRPLYDSIMRRAASALAQYMPTPAVAVAESIGAVMRRTYEKRRAKPYTTTGMRAGWVETNSELNQTDLYGQIPWQLGAYQKIRTAVPVAATAMDQIRGQVSGLEFDIVPRSESPDLDQIMCAAAVKWAMTHMEHLTLAEWVADRLDALWTNGFVVEELSLTQDGRPYLFRIPPYQVREFITSSADLRNLEQVRINQGNSGEVYLDAFKIAWFGLPMHEGQWWGVSKFRRLLSLLALYEQDTQLYIDQARMARGIVYAQETEATTSDSSRTALMDWMIDFLNGIDSPIVLDRGVDLKAIETNSPQANGFVDRRKQFNQEFRECLFESLGSLGVDGMGARSLGETVTRVNAEKLSASISEGLSILSGDRSRYSCTLSWLSSYYGFDPVHCCPKIVAKDLTADDTASTRQAFVDLVGAGVTLDQFSPKSIAKLIEDAGLEPSAALDALEDGPSAPMTLPTPPVPAGPPTFDVPPDVALAAASAMNLSPDLSADQRVAAQKTAMRARQIAAGMPIPILAVRRIVAWRIANFSYADAPPGSLEWQQWQASGGPTAGAWLSSIVGGRVP